MLTDVQPKDSSRNFPTCTEKPVSLTTVSEPVERSECIPDKTKPLEFKCKAPWRPLLPFTSIPTDFKAGPYLRTKETISTLQEPCKYITPKWPNSPNNIDLSLMCTTLIGPIRPRWNPGEKWVGSIEKIESISPGKCRFKLPCMLRPPLIWIRISWKDGLKLITPEIILLIREFSRFIILKLPNSPKN